MRVTRKRVAGASVAALLAVGAGAGVAMAQPNPNPAFVLLAPTARNVVTDNNRPNGPTGSFDLTAQVTLFNNNLIGASVTCNLVTNSPFVPAPGILDSVTVPVPGFGGPVPVALSGSVQALAAFNTRVACNTTAATPGGVFAGPNSSIVFTSV
jgi:hypothetical protein